jgi:formate dehydrogenase subunit delta
MSLDNKPLDNKLVYMANQIGKFFASLGEEQAVAGTAEHIQKFWNPRMRTAIFAHLAEGGAGLDPNVRAALEKLQAATSAQTQT